MQYNWRIKGESGRYYSKLLFANFEKLSKNIWDPVFRPATATEASQSHKSNLNSTDNR